MTSNEQRDWLIHAAASRKTFVSVGRQFGITGSRVAQIWHRQDGDIWYRGKRWFRRQPTVAALALLVWAGEEAKRKLSGQRQIIEDQRSLDEGTALLRSLDQYWDKRELQESP